MRTLYELEGQTIHPDAHGTLADHRGRVTLVVNVASACGFTPQYAGLEALHRELGARGLSVIGFPCDQFGGQEPGSHAEIAEFCRARFEVTFPIFEKVAVHGPARAPFYALVEATLGAAPRWNFAKVLVDRRGVPIGYYESGVAPDDGRLREDLERALGDDL